MSEWIDSKISLPNEDGRYLCVHNDGGGPTIMILDTTMETGDWDAVDGVSWYSYESGLITHWMPLPEAP